MVSSLNNPPFPRCSVNDIANFWHADRHSLPSRHRNGVSWLKTAIWKSEAPTPHRLEKAREDGQIPRSRELTSVLMLLSGLAIILMSGSNMAQQLAAMLTQG